MERELIVSLFSGKQSREVPYACRPPGSLSLLLLVYANASPLFHSLATTVS